LVFIGLPTHLLTEEFQYHIKPVILSSPQADEGPPGMLRSENALARLFGPLRGVLVEEPCRQQVKTDTSREVLRPPEADSG